MYFRSKEHPTTPPAATEGQSQSRNKKRPVHLTQMKYSLCPSRVKKLLDLGLRWKKGGVSAKGTAV